MIVLLTVIRFLNRCQGLHWNWANPKEDLRLQVWFQGRNPHASVYTDSRTIYLIACMQNSSIIKYDYIAVSWAE